MGHYLTYQFLCCSASAHTIRTCLSGQQHSDLTDQLIFIKER